MRNKTVQRIINERVNTYWLLRLISVIRVELYFFFITKILTRFK